MYASVLQNGPLNLFIIFSRHQFDSLDMFDRLQACGRDTVSIGIIRFQDRPLPGQEIRHRHRILPSVALRNAETIIQGHMILRKVVYLIGKQTRFQRHQRGKGPAGSQRSLILYRRRPACCTAVIGHRKHLRHRIRGISHPISSGVSPRLRLQRSVKFSAAHLRISIALGHIVLIYIVLICSPLICTALTGISAVLPGTRKCPFRHLEAACRPPAVNPEYSGSGEHQNGRRSQPFSCFQLINLLFSASEVSVP